MNIYDQMASERVIQWIAKGRAAAEKSRTTNNHDDWKFIEGQILEQLWKNMGTFPVCTKAELREAIEHCLTSPHLREDLAVDWLRQHLQALSRRSKFPLCQLRHMDGWRNATGLGEGTRWTLKVSGINECTWHVEKFEKRWPSGLFADASFFSLLIGAKGVSQSEFSRLADEIEDVAHTVTEVLDQTSVTLIDEHRRDGPEKHDDIIEQSLRQAESDCEAERRCIELWLQPPSKNDQLQRRLRTAIGLMTQAIKAEHEAVALALWCAAIEAMVVRKGSDTGISESFASNTTTLLLPAAELRLPAMKQVKKLYNARSDLIHGNTIEESPQLCRDARNLAAGVFRAMMQWMREHDTIDQKVSADDAFFDALRLADKTGRAVVGVSPLLWDCLPGHSEWRTESG